MANIGQYDYNSEAGQRLIHEIVTYALNNADPGDYMKSMLDRVKRDLTAKGHSFKKSK